MFRFKLDLEFGRVPDEEPTPEPEPEDLPGSTFGNAQVEDAGYGSKPAQWTGTGFCLPHTEDPGPEGPY